MLDMYLKKLKPCRRIEMKLIANKLQSDFTKNTLQHVINIQKWFSFLGSFSDITSNVTNYLLYISMFSSTDLVMSDNMFTLILTILLLYFVVKLQMYIYL